MNTSAPANYVIRIDGHLGELLGLFSRSDAGVRQAVRHATAPDRPELLTVRSVCSFRRADKVAL